MMKFLLIVSSLIAIANTEKLPAYYKKCRRNDANFDQCLLTNANTGIKYLAEKGEPSLKLHGLKPLIIERIVSQASPQLKITFNKAKFSGFDNLKFSHISLTDDEFMANMSMSYFEFNSEYDVDGKILFLPIVGNGNCSIKSDYIKFTYAIKLKKEEKDGKMYYQVNSEKVDLVPEKIVYDLQNLFGGNKFLGDQMNKFLNEHWLAVFKEVKGGIVETVQSIFHIYIAGHLTRIPVEDLIE